MKKLLSGRASIRDSIQETAYANLYLLPSRFSNRKMDILLDRIKKPGKRFSKIFSPVKKDFSWIFLDCPTNISRVSENIFRYVDYLLVPIIPTTLSLRTYESLIAFFLSKKLNRELIIPFFSMVEKRKKMHREIMEMLWLRDGRILKKTIPYLSDIEKMGVHKKPLLAFRSSSPAADAYRGLWDEFLTVT
jgi:cellulose biosynthesis protein BcsQ